MNRDGKQPASFSLSAEKFLSSDIFLVILGVVVFLWWNKHEKGLFLDAMIYTTLAKNLAAGGSFWSLTFTTESMTHFYQHAPLLFWLQALVFRIFSFSPFTAHLVPLVASTVTVLGVYRIGTIIRNPWTGLFAVFVLLLSPSFLKVGGTPYIEPLLTMSIVLTVLFYIMAVEKNPGWLLLAGFSAGLGLLSKGPLIFGIVAVLFLDVLVNKRFKLFKSWQLYASILIFISLPAVWIVPDLILNKGAWTHYYLNSQILGSLHGRGNHVKTDYLFYAKQIFLYQPHVMIPFLIGLFAALRGVFRERYNFLLAAWFLFYFIGLSLMKWQLAHYIHPVFPAVALVTAIFLAKLLEKRQTEIKLGAKLVLIAAMAFLVIFTNGPNNFRNRDLLTIVDYLQGYKNRDYGIAVVRRGQHPWSMAGMIKTYCDKDLKQFGSIAGVVPERARPLFVIVPREAFPKTGTEKKFRVLIATPRYYLLLADPGAWQNFIPEFD